MLVALGALCLPACSWHYEASHEVVGEGREQLVFYLRGYDLLYGEPLSNPWVVTYPSSAVNSSSGVLSAKELTSIKQLGEEDLRGSVSGSIQMEGKAKIRVSLAQDKVWADGSHGSVDLPFNGTYRLSR